MVGGWPLFTENALDGIYDKAKVVSVDTLPQQLEYVRKDQVQVLVGQDCYGWGFESVRLIANKVHNDKDPAESSTTSTSTSSPRERRGIRRPLAEVARRAK
jgi:ribose transport system substrate-binding protein